ncbi:MAG: PEP-CTERM sorting domain-containing protein [Planctomycetota bacterium]
MRSKMLALSLTGLLAGATSQAGASLLVYEGFDYDSLATTTVNGTTGGTGWGGAWGITGGGPTVSAAYSSTSLVNPAFPSIGGSLAVDHNTFGATRSFDLTNADIADAVNLSLDGSLYFSFVYRPSTTTSSNIQFTGLSDPVFARFFSNNIAATAGSGTFSSAGGGAFTPGSSYFVIGKFTKSAAGNDVLSLNVLGESDPIGPESFIVSSAGAALSGSLTGITVLQGDPANNNGTPAFFDEFRLGTTYESVTADAVIPEPGSIALLACGFALVAARRRRG